MKNKSTKKRNIVGQTFGFLSVIEDAPKRRSIGGHSFRRSKCLCVCGNTTFADNNDIARGQTTSCGCKSPYRRIHGLSHKSKSYFCWASMKARCFEPELDAFKHYGGRGITVCQRWLDSFENFHTDMGERPRGMTLDRINNDGNYEPSNCRWATTKQQSRNKRTNRIVTFRGVRACVVELMEQFSVSRHTVLKATLAQLSAPAKEEGK